MKEREVKYILLGIGNPMKGDDGIGPLAAELLKSMEPPGWMGINAELVPENFTGVVRRHHPELLVLVDAADMGLEPGEIRIIPGERIGVMHFSTHSIPMSVFMDQMRDSAGNVMLLGIQIDTANTELGMEISAEAEAWAGELIRKLVAEGPQSFRSL